MKYLLDPLSEDQVIGKIKKSPLPVQVWGANTGVRPLLSEYFREKDRFMLVVTYDDKRAEKLAKMYKGMANNVFVYPAKDALFYYADIHGNITSEKRLDIIKRIYKRESSVIITTVDGLMDKLPDMKYFRDHTFDMKVGDEIDMKKIMESLAMLGYENVAMVESKGQFSVRGGILDIFPLTEECPARVEFFGDEIDSIRYFDASTQRSIEKLEKIQIFPASEYVLSKRRIEAGLQKMEEEGEKVAAEFKKTFKTEAYARVRDLLKKTREDMTEWNSNTGIDSLVTYFYGTTVSFLDYLPKDTTVIVDEPAKVEQRASGYFKEFSISMEGRLENGYILPEQADLLYPHTAIIGKMEKMKTAMLSEFHTKTDVFKEASNIHVESKSIVSFNGNITSLADDIKKWRKEEFRLVIVSPSETRAKRIVDTLNNDDNIPAFYTTSATRVPNPREVMVTKGSLEEGFELRSSRLICIAESEILNQKDMKSRKKLPKKYSGETISSLDEINVGDYVVHERHGVGIYKGIEKVDTDGRLKDYINIDYADHGRLFIPVDQLSMIGKYSRGDGRKPKLNKLGGQEWAKTTARVKKHVDDIADELIQLYAARQSMKGFEYNKDNVWQREFEELFPYSETRDQIKAIEDTKKDMESSKIMDRLICGDVGFGKTEVAIRAAFKAVQDSRQVAYLVPTTILAEQHYENFCNRMKNYPIKIKMLSRFCTAKEVKETLKGMEDGSVDIVIGTHRLLSKDIKFKSLGLLIIDEEQRFGVKAKETIKEMKKSVDVLTLTATPIPRTLHMSLVGVRDMSLLEEAPVARRPIQTYVMEYDREIVKEAINRELARGGQVYYVYNRVDDIERITSELRALLPEVRVEYAHGKMKERELENILHDFINKEIDVMVSTTIIETGLDIPNVNTIIIHNADNFGLSQLYQLRGRVGRSDRSAYAFLMYRRDKVIKEVAEKRLSAIREFTDLGSGYKISMKDLEIRGAGNMLGASQSGHEEEIGYELYVKMLNAAIRRRKGEEVAEDFDTSIDLPVDAYIPDEYVRNEYLKLELYKRISHIEDAEDEEAIIEEVKDRFGEPPRTFLRLLTVARIKAAAHKAYITDIRFTDGEVFYIIKSGSAIHVDRIPTFLKLWKKKARLVTAKRSGFAVKTQKLIQDDMLEDVANVVRDIDALLIADKVKQEELAARLEKSDKDDE